MNIVLLEPFMVGSHASWSRQYAAFSRHHVEILGLEGKYWKWRMHGGAVSLARQFIERDLRPDLLLASDMLDLTTFLALTRRQTGVIPCALYCHENQLSYPWSPDDADPGLQRDAHYCFINYTSALTADRVFFNSDYHRKDFLAELPNFLKTFPDHRGLETVGEIAQKCHTLSLGLDLNRLAAWQPSSEDVSCGGKVPIILWNHRWEYDKNPDDFFRALFVLQQRGIDFKLVVLGESYQKQPAIFAEARQRLDGQILHWGYADDYADYVHWLWLADILPVTSIHDFFGISVVEAVYCGCFPLLPERLAYPEHLDRNLFPGCYYQNFDDLVAKLATLCLAQQANDVSSMRDAVSRYDWSAMAPRYDHEFDQMALRLSG